MYIISYQNNKKFQAFFPFEFLKQCSERKIVRLKEKLRDMRSLNFLFTFILNNVKLHRFHLLCIDPVPKPILPSYAHSFSSFPVPCYKIVMNFRTRIQREAEDKTCRRARNQIATRSQCLAHGAAMAFKVKISSGTTWIYLFNRLLYNNTPWSFPAVYNYQLGVAWWRTWRPPTTYNFNLIPARRWNRTVKIL